ncbi:MAG: glycosyltransferase family 8 protein [Methylacidiphilales bacterium]|nr:glycosyltransferase family 8 protein [Candidatus Methylacidiphilales bacterium]
MNSPFHVALCCNESLLPGLHATLASLTRNLGRREKVELHLFISGIDEASQLELRRTVAESGGVGVLQFHEMDLSDFQDLRTLHGDRTIYMRLKLPDLLPDASLILYLDSDLIVNTDVCEMFALPLGDAPFGAVMAEPVSWSLDRDVFRKLGLNDDDRCLNSGVILFNAAVWRKTGVTQQALEFARTHPTLLKSHDQTILNALFSRTYCDLPKHYNAMLSPESRPVVASDAIYHFMGSPKPWDPLGNILHRNWRLWKDVIGKTRFRWSAFLAGHAGSYAARAWALRYSYLRVVKRRVTGMFKPEPSE